MFCVCFVFFSKCFVVYFFATLLPLARFGGGSPFMFIPSANVFPSPHAWLHFSILGKHIGLPLRFSGWFVIGSLICREPIFFRIWDNSHLGYFLFLSLFFFWFYWFSNWFYSFYFHCQNPMKKDLFLEKHTNLFH